MRSKKYYIFPLILSLVLLAISLIGILGPKKEYLTTTGIIVDFKENYDSADDTYNTITIIDYSVDGKEYKNVEYGSYNSSMKINDEVIVYYEANDPTHIQAEGFEKVPYIVGGAALVVLVFSIVMFLRK